MPIEVGDWLSQPGSGALPPCGLFTSASVPVPLRRRDVVATIHASASFADTQETLSYVSDVDCTAVFKFPLPPRSAVYSFRAVVGDREVVTRIKPRAEAREEYELAVRQGHSAVHMSQHAAGASVFEVTLGNLEAHTEVAVSFSYLRLLDSFGGATLEWAHTATWVPPYAGSAGDVAAGVDTVMSAMPVFAAKVGYSLSYTITVLAEAGAVRSIESPEPVTVVRPPPGAAGAGSGGKGAPGRWVVTQSGEVADPSKDLTLLIEMDPAAASRTGLMVQRTPASRGSAVRTVALATFVPPPPPPPPAASAGPDKPQLRKEIWFVVDCSGSMGGSPIQQAREAALFCVRDLPVDSGVSFNVTCFGSAHKSLYDSCRAYDAATEGQAVAWIQEHVEADMGGTEILDTLKHVYSRPVAPGYSREIIFLTDGGISGHEEQALYDIVQGGSSSPNGQPPTAAAAAPPPPPPPRASVASRLMGLLPGGKHGGGGGGGGGGGDAADVAARTHVLCLGIGHGVHRGVLDGMLPHGRALWGTNGGAERPGGGPQQRFSQPPCFSSAAPMGGGGRGGGHFPLTGRSLQSARKMSAAPMSYAVSPSAVQCQSVAINAAPPSGQQESIERCRAVECVLRMRPEPLAQDTGLHDRQDTYSKKSVHRKEKGGAGPVGSFLRGVGGAIASLGMGGGGGSAAAPPPPPPAPAVAAAAAAAECAAPKGSAAVPSCRRSVMEQEEEREEEQAEQEEGGGGSQAGGVFGSDDDDTSGASAGSPASGGPAAPAAAPEAAAAAAPTAAALSGPELLNFLNLHRTTAGYWAASGQLAEALGVPAGLLLAARQSGDGGGVVHPAAAARPVGLSDDAWATAVVLAALRRCLGAQREVWADMEAKALGWLGGCWPAGARSVGSVVLSLVKLLG
ncbi:von Willebrand factor A domain-containing protein 5A [Tetrabaena socialis]|uniref:von Willebrand factor A domain-containing protein 5A n=1 Tax=Tetrabaena socialis TaxID=47790 RepID=A0A2J7ZY27_9CHLO|nr:von Willebrand factor A domain-containing protein 5A [Tetrabaena socialis]|eukprot:PNH05173.1 von Willebrand factor A domain-containing protein 5A [Tetrabaena socialis]